MHNAQDFNLYANRPDLYDLMHAEVVDDMRFIHEFAATLGDAPEVLELGCGTGRLLTGLLDAGATVTGIDSEPSMLSVARERLAGYGSRVQLHQGDMRRFALHRRFDLAVVGLNTFMQLLVTRDQIECLSAIREHLRPGALLVLDLANPHTALRELPLGLLQHRFTRQPRPDGSETVTLWSVTAAAPARQIVQSTLFFDETEAQGGTLRRTVAEVTLRLIYRYELELLLARTGFSIRQLYGDYESTPYDDESDRLICVAAAFA